MLRQRLRPTLAGSAGIDVRYGQARTRYGLPEDEGVRPAEQKGNRLRPAREDLVDERR